MGNINKLKRIEDDFDKWIDNDEDEIDDFNESEEE